MLNQENAASKQNGENKCKKGVSLNQCFSIVFLLQGALVEHLNLQGHTLPFNKEKLNIKFENMKCWFSIPKEELCDAIRSEIVTTFIAPGDDIQG